MARRDQLPYTSPSPDRDVVQSNNHGELGINVETHFEDLLPQSTDPLDPNFRQVDTLDVSPEGDEYEGGA